MIMSLFHEQESSILLKLLDMENDSKNIWESSRVSRLLCPSNLIPSNGKHKHELLGSIQKVSF